jgi:hypothetical protein
MPMKTMLYWTPAFGDHDEGTLGLRRVDGNEGQLPFLQPGVEVLSALEIVETMN